jgi:hypothetical protein
VQGSEDLGGELVRELQFSPCELLLREAGSWDTEIVQEPICDYEAIANARFRHLGQFFMEPSDYYDAPIGKVLHFIRSVGLIKG